jgi:TolB-like protein/Tfp pilus assembly protein PilF
MASFFTELKRRNVFKVGVAYAIVAWLLIQIAVNVLPTFDAPRWVLQTITFVIILGFPLALLFAWAFELTPEGIKTTKSVDPEESIRATTGHKLNYTIIALLSLTLVFVVMDNYLFNEDIQTTESTEPIEVEVARPQDNIEPATTASTRLPNSIAILPFTNLSPDPDNAYFAAGIHESTLNQLAKIRDISVIARTTVMQYADNPLPIPDIAEALNVEMVMEGSVRYANNRVLITAQLIDGQTGTHIWSDEFDRDLTDIFGVQAEIAENIASALQAEILLEEKQRIEKIQTKSPEALALYLKASNFISDLEGVGPNDELHRLLDQAIELDSGFARAHALKAYDYAFAMVRAKEPDDLSAEVLEQLALTHVVRALSLDVEDNLAFVTMANIHRFNWRATEAEGAFERALALAPNDYLSTNSFAHFLSFLGEYDRAIALAKRAQELNPEIATLHIVYLRAGNLDASYMAAKKVYDTAPTIFNYSTLVEVEWLRGNHESAISYLQEMYENIQINGPDTLVSFLELYRLVERTEDVLRLFNRLEQMAESHFVSASNWAIAYLAKNDLVRALEWLQRIDEDRKPEDSIPAFGIAINQLQNPILERPEFLEIRNKIRLKR